MDGESGVMLVLFLRVIEGGGGREEGKKEANVKLPPQASSLYIFHSSATMVMEPKVTLGPNEDEDDSCSVADSIN